MAICLLIQSHTETHMHSFQCQFPWRPGWASTRM